MTQPIRVVVADDQTLVREGLVTLLELMDGIQVVGAAADGNEAVALVKSEAPDIVLMDLRMPHMDGAEATRQILASRPDTRVIVLTTYDDDESILSALEAGARGYLTKASAAADIRRAIEEVHAGQSLLEPSVQSRLISVIASGRPAGSRRANVAGLTARELDVIRLIAAGLSNADIAGRLFISETTVKTHINRILAKTGARDRAQAVTFAFHHGLAT
jgi:DNA-binding NarL/FixJ family response regulator